MTKETFLQQLRKDLQPLSEEDINEIIEDYSLLIEEQVLEGKEEQDVVQSLEKPADVAFMHKEELLGEEEIFEMPKKQKRMGTFIALQILNLLVVLWLFVTGGALILSIGVASIVLLVISPTILFTWIELSFLFKVSGMLMSIGGALLLGCGVVIAANYFSIMVRKYIIWNASFIK